ncbi:unnamed protein product [Caenorhabditis auriculariae]|uniref:WDR11 second beta-propeller domain-containing protein n=1 Tax=Caenorhabditis auriculariae TaxID=2777116 RepID=A0A8S1GNY4_9PELO|nr:unnamed protein product [Caenorhabditis auriculariae]
MPNITPGCLHPSNGRQAIHWSDYGLLAYASHNVILIVDVIKNRRIQTLDFQTTAVNIVRWSPARCSFRDHGVYTQLLASADIAGHIIVVDPFTATKKSQFALPHSSVLQMTWFAWKDISRDFMLVLHSGNTLILWNCETGEKVWSHNYSVPLFDFSTDPFASRNIIFSSVESNVLVCSDVSLSEPSSSGHYFSLSQDNVKSNNTNIVSINYHKAYRNTVFCLSNVTLYILNPELLCIMARVCVEGNIVELLPCSSRDALFAVHSNGATTLRIGTFSLCDERDDISIGLEKICQTECLRHSAQQRIVAVALCPVTQSSLAVLYQNGRLIFWQLKNELTSLKYRSAFIEDLLQFDTDLKTSPIGDLSLHQVAQIGSLASSVTCVRMRPMDELAKIKEDPFANSTLGTSHLAAVGTNSGVVHLVDVFSGQIFKDISAQASPIKCLEWGGAYSVVTAGYNHSLSASQVVRNDLFITDIRTSLSRRIRPESDESPIVFLRVSHYHCYLALAFQNEPLEIWDLKGLRLLRRMSRTCPLIIDMAWSNKHHGIRTTEASNQSVYRENLVLLDSENRIYHITLRGLHVRDGKIVNTQWKSASTQICAMAWKDDMLAVGDVDGSLVVWDLGRRQSKQVRDTHSRVLRMCFSRLAGDHTMAVLHPRELSLWDTEAMTRVQSVQLDAMRSSVDMDLCGLSPLVLTSDNQLRFLVSNTRNSAIADKDVPFLHIENALDRIRTAWDRGDSSGIPEMNAIVKRKKRGEVPAEGIDMLPLHNEKLLRYFVGDLYAVRLLSVIIDHLAREDPDADLPHLSPDLQMFWANKAFKERETRVVGVACNSSNAIESRLVEQAVVVGGKAKERVVDRLIVSSDFRYASIKAALLVSSQESEKAKSLIKLIATNLIASDMIEDGVELLFLVGAGSDACKYLQSQKLWTKSVVYAKMGLDDPTDVVAKWIGHLSEDSKSLQAVAEAARANWPVVVELTSSNEPELARLVLRTTTSSPPLSKSPSPRLPVSTP